MEIIGVFIMTREFMTEIPTKIKGKVEDKNWSETFIFEEMPCNHDPNAKQHIKVNCEKCNYDKREFWLEDELKKMQGNETTTDMNGNTKTLDKIIVKRGRMDDCIGIERAYK